MRSWYLLFFLSCITSSWAQSPRDYQAAEQRVHGIFLYNFTRYVQWPDGYNQGTFLIGFLGDAPLRAEAEKLAHTRQVNGRPVRVEVYQSVNQIPAHCHVLFVAADRSILLSEVLSRTRAQPTLVMTQKEGLGLVGSPVNFVRSGNRPGFEINVQALEQRHLHCLQPLLRQATLL